MQAGSGRRAHEPALVCRNVPVCWSAPDDQLGPHWSGPLEHTHGAQWLKCAADELWAGQAPSADLAPLSARRQLNARPPHERPNDQLKASRSLARGRTTNDTWAAQFAPSRGLFLRWRWRDKDKQGPLCARRPRRRKGAVCVWGTLAAPNTDFLVAGGECARLRRANFNPLPLTSETTGAEGPPAPVASRRRLSPARGGRGRTGTRRADTCRHAARTVLRALAPSSRALSVTGIGASKWRSHSHSRPPRHASDGALRIGLSS